MEHSLSVKGVIGRGKTAPYVWMRKVLNLVAAFALCTAMAATAYNESDVDLLARLISAEARGEPFEGQIAVGTVVMNRLDDGRWGDTLHSVIYAKGQFARPYPATDSTRKAAEMVLLEGMRNLPPYILFFQRAKAPYFYTLKGTGAGWYCTIGNHNFYGDYQEGEEKWE